MNVFCNKCGWCHFEVTAEYIRKWKDEWEEYCRTWPEEKLELYGIKNRNPPSINQYLQCFLCSNSYKDFGETGKVPYGSTIQPILNRNESERATTMDHQDIKEWEEVTMETAKELAQAITEINRLKTRMAFKDKINSNLKLEIKKLRKRLGIED